MTVVDIHTHMFTAAWLELLKEGGGTLPYLVGRFEMADRVECDHLRQIKRKPRDYLRDIYCGSITYDLAPLKHLLDLAGTSQVMLGTDWPHRVHEADVAVSQLDALNKQDQAAICEGNARRIFGCEGRGRPSAQAPPARVTARRGSLCLAAAAPSPPACPTHPRRAAWAGRCGSASLRPCWARSPCTVRRAMHLVAGGRKQQKGLPFAMPSP